jgi:peptidoglycan hydrolase-like protein with peptidoglycan-binding domain
MKKVTLLFAFLLSLQQVSALTCVDFSENLFRTDENNNIKVLQDFLYEKGYLKATPNGYFGPGTFAAVKEYQTAKGINPTGVVGPLTRESLKTATCTASSSPASSPAKTSTTIPNTVPKTETATPASKATTTLPTKIVCTSLTEGLGFGSESAAVLSLQEYLYLKGYLKATPNGYFGPGTYAAVIVFQNENGITQTGTVGPLTREKLKANSCGITTPPPNKPVTEASKPVVVATTTPSQPKATSSPVVAAKPEVAAPVSSKNQQRFADAETILSSMYQYIVVSRGSWPAKASSTVPVELCVTPRVTEMASSAEVAVLATKDSPCKDVLDVAFLSPGYLKSVPRDPTLASTSVMTGYTLLRGEYGDVTIAPKVTDNKEIIKVRCNFNQGCKPVTKISAEEYGVPFVTTLSRTVLLRESLPKEGVLVTGRNFAATNTVMLQSKLNQRVYEIGSFPSTDGKTFTISASTTNVELPCGTGCKEKLPTGDYSVQIKTAGGESNVVYLSVKAFTTSSILARANATVAASSTNVKLGTITVSTGLPGTLKSLTLRASSTSSKLPGKVTNFKLKDLVSNTTINGSGLTFSLSDTSLPENNSRYYDLYADVGNVLVDEAGQVTYAGDFLMRDTLGKVDINLPIKEVTFSASP